MHRSAAVILDRGSLFAGRYLIERVVGSGGMGVVYQVRDRQTARRRALKVLSTGGSRGAWRGSDLPREVLVGAAIDSPHVVDIIDAGVDPYTGFFFLAMELLRGEDLARRQARLGRCPPAEVAVHLHQVGRALQAIHRAGVVHRDLKPANIFLCHTAGVQIIKVLDFGIAKLADSAEVLTAGPRSGTPAYMAPEQLRGDAVTAATDVFALGMIAFELLVGRRFPPAYGPPAVPQERRLTARQQLTEWGMNLELPAAFDDWFARATAPLPGDRFPDAMLAVDALAVALNIEVPPSVYLPVGDAPPSSESSFDDSEEPSDPERGLASRDPQLQPGRRETDPDEVVTALLLPRTALSQRAETGGGGSLEIPARDEGPKSDEAFSSEASRNGDLPAPGAGWLARHRLLWGALVGGAAAVAVALAVTFGAGRATSRGPSSPAPAHATQGPPLRKAAQPDAASAGMQTQLPVAPSHTSLPGGTSLSGAPRFEGNVQPQANVQDKASAASTSARPPLHGARPKKKVRREDDFIYTRR